MNDLVVRQCAVCSNTQNLCTHIFNGGISSIASVFNALRKKIVYECYIIFGLLFCVMRFMNGILRQQNFIMEWQNGRTNADSFVVISLGSSENNSLHA